MANDNTGSGNSGNTAAAQPSNSGGSSSSNNTPAPAPAPAPAPTPVPEPTPAPTEAWAGQSYCDYALNQGWDYNTAVKYANCCLSYGQSNVIIGIPDGVEGAWSGVWVLTDPENDGWSCFS